MTYKGARARPMASEDHRFFEVSKVRFDRDGHVCEVLWGEVSSASDQDVGPRVLAPVSEVLDAIHAGARVLAVFASGAHLPDRWFGAVERAGGGERLDFDEPSSTGRNLSDMVRLAD